MIDKPHPRKGMKIMPDVMNEVDFLHEVSDFHWVVCLTCHQEFYTEAGERCPDCFPEDHHA